MLKFDFVSDSEKMPILLVSDSGERIPIQLEIDKMDFNPSFDESNEEVDVRFHDVQIVKEPTEKIPSNYGKITWDGFKLLIS